MSLLSINATFNKKIALITPAIATVKEGESYTPVIDTPYQTVYLITADPINPFLGSKTERVVGFYQISLFYPFDVGAGAILTRGDLLKTTFYRGLTLVEDGINVIIDKTPSNEARGKEGDFLKRIIKISFFADIY